MRSVGRITVRSSAICKPRSLLHVPPLSATLRAATAPTRSIYTDRDPQRTTFGFAAGIAHTSQLHTSRSFAQPIVSQQQWQNASTGFQQPEQIHIHGHTGFVPVPFVQEQIAGVHHSTDLFSRLLKERIVACYGPIEDRMAATITASLLFLESESDAPISMYINSPGGSVSAGLSVYDTMQYISAPVTTIVLGQAASMGSLLAAAGTPGKRFVLPHATIMMHQPSGGYSGTSADIQIHAKEIMRIRNQLNGIYHRHLNEKTIVERRGREIGLEEIEKLMDRDYFMSADEAFNLGVADEVLQSRKKLGDEEKKG